MAVRDGAGDRDTEGEEIEQVGPPPLGCKPPSPVAPQGPGPHLRYR